MCFLQLGAWRLARTFPVFLWLCASTALAQEDSPVVRWSAEDVKCPTGTKPRQEESPDGQRSARWCELSREGKIALFGPYLELYADGSTARQGRYQGGRQVGRWTSWTPAGEVEESRVLWPGEAGRHIPRPEDLCPPGSTRKRSRGHDDRQRLWSHCYTKNEAGERVLTGPYVTWDEEKASGGGYRYVLREIMSYRDGERHGPYRVYEGPFGKEVLVEEGTFSEGSLDGVSRSLYFDGTVRELRRFLDGQLDGERVGYSPDGSQRWRARYEAGRLVSIEGELAVGGEPCPESTVPFISASGREEACARRHLHFLERHGAFLIRDPQGRVVERGLYRDGKKTEQWQAPPEARLPPEVSEDILVAQVELVVGERPYLEIQTPPEEDPWASAKLHHPDRESLEAELAAVEARVQELAEEAAARTPFHIWFRDRKTRDYPSPRTRVKDGVVSVYGLAPGKYYMKVEIDANRANARQWPGDLMSSLEFEVREGEVAQARAQLLHTLHLVSPWDNDLPIPGFRYPCRDEEAELVSPVAFAWKVPPDEEARGIEYEYRLLRRGCDPLRNLEVMAEGTTDSLHLDFDLPPSRPGELYEWSLSARRGERYIGQMMTFGDEGGYGWSLRFRVNAQP